jgi:uncharacterized membrane protein
MNQAEFNQEHRVAEVQAEVRQERGVSWAVISFALIIATLIIGGILFTFLPSDIFNRSNQQPPSSSAPADGR